MTASSYGWHRPGEPKSAYLLRLHRESMRRVPDHGERRCFCLTVLGACRCPGIKPVLWEAQDCCVDVDRKRRAWGNVTTANVDALCGEVGQ